MNADCTPIRDGVAKEGALSASEIAAIALKPDEAKLAQEKQDTLDHFDQLFKQHQSGLSTISGTASIYREVKKYGQCTL